MQPEMFRQGGREAAGRRALTSTRPSLFWTSFLKVRRSRYHSTPSVSAFTVALRACGGEGATTGTEHGLEERLGSERLEARRRRSGPRAGQRWAPAGAGGARLVVQERELAEGGRHAAERVLVLIHRIAELRLRVQSHFLRSRGIKGSAITHRRS